ncbi:MAG: VWA domain-containing protein [Planctomycetes bacterium]|nr:VWA domain-containing protein [Planctomycetota bacterium]
MNSHTKNRSHDATPQVEIQASFDREALGTADPEAHLIVRLRGKKAAPGAPTPPVSLAIVIDASGSMGGAKLANVKHAALLLARRLRPCDRIAVVSFADDVVIHCRPQAMTAEQLALIEAELRTLRTRGSTDLSAGWLTGAALLEPIIEPGRRTHVILLSDGMANRGLCDPTALGERARALRLAGITTTCVGVGAGYSTTQLGPIAEHGGGRFHHADEAHAIERLLLGELEELGAVAVRNVCLGVDAGPDPVVEPVSELVAARSGDQPGTPGGFLLGDLVDGAERTVVFRVKLRDPAVRPTPWQVRVTLAGQHADGSRELTPIESICVLPPSDAGHVPPRPEDAEVVAGAWSASVLRRAADFNERELYPHVQDLLRTEARRMSEYVRGIRQAESALRRACALVEKLTSPVPPPVQKEVFQQGYKGSKGERDLRTTR